MASITCRSVGCDRRSRLAGMCVECFSNTIARERPLSSPAYSDAAKEMALEHLSRGTIPLVGCLGSGTIYEAVADIVRDEREIIGGPVRPLSLQEIAGGTWPWT